ncbi:unnamed protein product [Alternaria alternata]
MQEQPLTKRLDYVFGKMLRYHTQSDDCAQDKVGSSTASEPCHDDNYNREDIQNEDQEVFAYNHDSTGAHVDPQLAALLNGPQWQKPNSNTRRATRADYSCKKPSQIATRKRPRKAKYRAADDNRIPHPVLEPETLARWNRLWEEELRPDSFVRTFISNKDDLKR